MKKTYWLSLVLAAALCVGVGSAAFAEKEETNCIGDPTGMTNCGSEVVEEEAGPALAVDVDELSFGRITELGRRYSKNVVISNNSSEKMTVRVEAQTFMEGDEGLQSAQDWVAFAGGKRKFDIKAGGKLQLGVRLMVPADIEGGTYYAKIKITNGDENLDKYVTVRADVVTEEYKYGGEISHQEVGFLNIGQKFSASAAVKNTGTAGFKATYTVNYKNAFGLPEWKTLKEEKREILPGKEESFSVDDKDEIGYGIFTVEQKISYVNAEGQAKEAILSHAVVNLPWWSFAILGGVILLIIVIVIIVKTRRKKIDQEEKAEKAKKSKKKTVVVKVEDE